MDGWRPAHTRKVAIVAAAPMQPAEGRWCQDIRSFKSDTEASQENLLHSMMDTAAFAAPHRTRSRVDWNRMEEDWLQGGNGNHWQKCSATSF